MTDAVASRGPLGRMLCVPFHVFWYLWHVLIARHFPQSVAMQQEVWLAVSSETEIIRLGELGVGKVSNVIGPPRALP